MIGRFDRAIIGALSFLSGFVLVKILRPSQPEPLTDMAQQMNFDASTDNKLLDNLRQRLNDLTISLDRLWCMTHQVGSKGGFCLTEENIFAGGNEVWDKDVCRDLEFLFGHSSVVDLGAGLGHYGKCFLRMKKSIFTMSTNQNIELQSTFESMMGDLLQQPQIIKSWDGYDGAINVGYLSNGFIKQQDLSVADMWLGRTWDWVLSLEVGEHIPALYEDIFIDNLVRHGCKGIVLSWAVENQGGHHHVNERSNAHVKLKMEAHGLVNDAEAEQVIREHTTLYWFKNTIMVFRYPSNYKCENNT